MNLSDITGRDMDPQPWEEGEAIPWDEPDFSRRMLREHLSQEHDAASRRTSIIKKHVDWIDNHILEGESAKVLDLGCGPGFYTSRLSALGHACRGIDFSPASIDFAVKHAPRNCSYTLGNIRTTSSGYDLVMLTFGEFNLFNPVDANLILEKSFNALKSGGKLLLEVSTFDAVYERGIQTATWYSAENELFADGPHLVLMESFWIDEDAVAIERYFVVDAHSGEVTRHTASQQAYSEDQLRDLIMAAGLGAVDTYPSLFGKEHPSQDELFVLVGHKI